jgi:hypothetical protein
VASCEQTTFCLSFCNFLFEEGWGHPSPQRPKTNTRFFPHSHPHPQRSWATRLAAAQLWPRATPIHGLRYGTYCCNRPIQRHHGLKINGTCSGIDRTMLKQTVSTANTSGMCTVFGTLYKNCRVFIADNKYILRHH